MEQVQNCQPCFSCHISPLVKIAAWNLTGNEQEKISAPTWTCFAGSFFCLKIWNFLGNQSHFHCTWWWHKINSALRALDCSWASWTVFCTMCRRISLCSLGCVYTSHNNLKTPLRKTTELAKGKEQPFKGSYSKQHFSSLQGLLTEQGWFLTLSQMLFFTPREC